MAIRSRSSLKGNNKSSKDTTDSNNESFEVREMDVAKKVIGCTSDEFSFIELLCFTMILPLLTTFLGSSVYFYGPKLLEPYFGNFFPYYYYSLVCFGSLFFGALLGMIYEKRFIKDLSPNLGRIGMPLALSPIFVEFIAKKSLSLGPYVSTHLSYLLPVYLPLISCAWINTSLFLKNRTFFKHTDTLNHSITLFTIHLATLVMGFGLFTTFPVIYTITNLTCHGILLNSLIASMGIYILNFSLLQNIRPTIYDKILIPSTIIGIILLIITRHAQCSVGLSDQYIEKEMVPGFIPLARQESITGWITVSEEKERKIRVMRSGHSIIGGMYPEYEESIFGSFYYMESIKYLQPQKNDRNEVLQIGLGIGVSAKSLIEEKYKVDIVEIDPVVYNYSREYFNLPEPNNVYLEDGRYFLEHKVNSSTYDFILHDVFTGGTVPSTLFSYEAVQLCHNALKPDGVLVLNFVGGVIGSYNQGFEMITSTLKSVFPYVRVFTEDFEGDEQKVLSGLINMVFFASDHPIIFDLPPISPTYRSIREHAITRMEKNEILLNKYLPELDNNKLLDKHYHAIVTDKNNKLNSVQHYSAYVHWYKMKELFPLEYWIKY